MHDQSSVMISNAWSTMTHKKLTIPKLLPWMSSLSYTHLFIKWHNCLGCVQCVAYICLLSNNLNDSLGCVQCLAHICLLSNNLNDSLDVFSGAWHTFVYWVTIKTTPLDVFSAICLLSDNQRILINLTSRKKNLINKQALPSLSSLFSFHFPSSFLSDHSDLLKRFSILFNCQLPINIIHLIKCDARQTKNTSHDTKCHGMTLRHNALQWQDPSHACV